MEVGEGRISVYGDSNCLDSSHMVTDCYWLLKKLLDFTGRNIKDPVLFSNSVKLKQPMDDNQLPIRKTDFNFSAYSAVIGKELICGNDSRFDVWATKGYGLQIRGRNRRLPWHHSIDLGSGLNSSDDTFVRKRFKNIKQNKENLPGSKIFRFLYTDDVRNSNFAQMILKCI